MGPYTYASLMFGGGAGTMVGGAVGALRAVGFFRTHEELTETDKMSFLTSELSVPCFTWYGIYPTCSNTTLIDVVDVHHKDPLAELSAADTCIQGGGVWGACSDGLDTAFDACNAEGNYWVRDEGYQYFLIVGGILLYFYIILIPVAVIYVTTRNEARLHETHFKAIFGFLYTGLNKYWWELVLLVRKGLITVILVFVADDPFL